MKKRFKLNYATQIALAVGLGVLVGVLFGSKAAVLGEFGGLLIRLLKTLATPLVFFAIVNAFCKTHIRARSGLRLLFISLMNAVVAGLIALSVSSLFSFANLEKIGGAGFTQNILSLAHEAPANGKNTLLTWDVVKTIDSLVPQNTIEPFMTNNVVSVVILAVLVGSIMRKLKQSKEAVTEVQVLESFFSGGLILASHLLSWVVKGVPIAVFGVIAKIVGSSGFGFLSTLGLFICLVSVGMALHGIVYYSILIFLVARKSPFQFYREGGEVFATALGTGSSLATLPVTLRTLRERMKISDESSMLAACVGTNLNHDGILLYEAVAVLFIAQVYGVPLVGWQKVLLLGTSSLAAVGIAGIPDAGLITLSLVLSSVGLPVGLVPVLMTVDWIVGRLRALTNVTSDMVVATVLDHWHKPSAS